MEKNIINIIRQLDDNKKFHKEVQGELRGFVLDKKNSLKERFRVWSEYCGKIHKSYIIHKGEFGIIGDLVDARWPSDYDKYREYTFNDFLDYIKNLDDYEDLPKHVKQPSTNEFKEMLIETNFGSFIMDW